MVSIEKLTAWWEVSGVYELIETSSESKENSGHLIGTSCVSQWEIRGMFHYPRSSRWAASQILTWPVYFPPAWLVYLSILNEGAAWAYLLAMALTSSALQTLFGASVLSVSVSIQASISKGGQLSSRPAIVNSR